MTNPADALMQFAQNQPNNENQDQVVVVDQVQQSNDGNVGLGVQTGENKKEKSNIIIDSKKISNEALREFVYSYRFGKNFSDHDILELIMGLDELIETDKLTNDMLGEVKEENINI